MEEGEVVSAAAGENHNHSSNTNTTTATTNRDESHLVLRVLELLKQASHDLQSNPTTALRGDNANNTDKPNPSSAAIKALLELEHESDSILSSDPNLTKLSGHLSSLKSLVHDCSSSSSSLPRSTQFGLRSFLRSRASAHKIARVAGSIESELQAWIDRESIERLVHSLDRFSSGEDDEGSCEELIRQLDQFAERVSEGFNRELQDLVLKSKVFTKLESVLCNNNSSSSCSATENTILLLRERCAFAIEALIRFNKNVFVGQVLMGPTVQALISMGTVAPLRVLCSLIRSIKSPLVDEIQSYGMIPDIIRLLSSEEVGIRVAGLDCVLEIGYFGRKEAVEAMIGEGLVERLVELQMSELGGDLIDVGRCVEEREQQQHDEEQNNSNSDDRSLHHHHHHGGRSGSRREKYLEAHPFASCVARFAVQLEVGEGLRKREKRAFKQEILRRIKEEASLSDAQAATIAAEVLWGASP